jgi:DNA-binding MarR family transcriptional regulator
VTKSAASQLISKLVQKGLVTKEQSAHSGKELQLTLTELGWQAYELHEEHHGKNIGEIAKRLDAFTITQITTSSQILDVIEDVLDERLGEE